MFGSSKLMAMAIGLTATMTFKAFAAGPGCDPISPTPNLAVRDGFVEFISPSVLQVLKDALPNVADPTVNSLLRDPDTMWYDEASMVFMYQDSIETVVGARANCVGRLVGERSRGSPVEKLVNYFGPDYRFKFPFRQAAGTDQVNNVRVLNFWSPPKRLGRAMPVKWWREARRGRWHWVFPVGTVFGEVLYEKAPNGMWYVFEVRTRLRYRDGWAPNVFRPFLNANELAQAVTELRPNWMSQPQLNAVVTHLRTPTNLTPHTLTSAFTKVFPPLSGALDQIPDFGDADLIIELLTNTTFKSAEGQIWKEGRGLETYAPGSTAEFSIVPKNYEIGMIPVNEVSCNRCHTETGHPIGHFEFDIILYGEIWGEDRIFTWHLFEPNTYVFNTWDEVDTPTRRLNPRLQQAGLVLNARPMPDDPDYRQLAVPYPPSGAFRLKP